MTEGRKIEVKKKKVAASRGRGKKLRKGKNSPIQLVLAKTKTQRKGNPICMERKKEVYCKNPTPLKGGWRQRKKAREWGSK